MRLPDFFFRFKRYMIKYSGVRLVQVSHHFFARAVELSDVLVSTVVWPELKNSENSPYWTWMSGQPPLGFHFSVCQDFGSGKQNEFKFLSVFIWNLQPTPWALHKPIKSLCFLSLFPVPCYNKALRSRRCTRRGGQRRINWIFEWHESRGRLSVSLLLWELLY